jgi:predicted lipoprotein with Yx(FWY)xxD motif
VHQPAAPLNPGSAGLRNTGVEQKENAMGTADSVRHIPGIRTRRLAGWALAGSLGAIVVIASACTPSASSPTSTVLNQRATSAKTAAAEVSTAQAGALGTILVDRSGFTLYRFSMDHPGASSCTGSCATVWPPLTVTTAHVAAGSGVAGSELGTITRSDGSLQVTFAGMPLYRFSGDKKAGDTSGQGVAGAWSVVNPSTAASAPAASTSTTGSVPSSAIPSTTAPSSGNAVVPGSGGGMGHAPAPPAPAAPPASAPPATQPPPTQPPPTAPPPTSPPTTQGGGGYGY